MRLLTKWHLTRSSSWHSSHHRIHSNTIRSLMHLMHLLLMIHLSLIKSLKSLIIISLWNYTCCLSDIYWKSYLSSNSIQLSFMLLPESFNTRKSQCFCNFIDLISLFLKHFEILLSILNDVFELEHNQDLFVNFFEFF
jgi:hypothetical protein